MRQRRRVVYRPALKRPQNIHQLLKGHAPFQHAFQVIHLSNLLIHTYSIIDLTCLFWSNVEGDCIICEKSSSTILSPGYPNDYGDFRECVVHITTMCAEKRIRLKFIEFIVEKNHDWINVSSCILYQSNILSLSS